MNAPVVVPRPREVDLSTTPLDGGVTVTEAVDPTLPPQGYALDLTAAGVRLRHADDAGRRYGQSTLDQLRRQGLVEGRIRDWPDLATRGFMLDVSRDRVPSREGLRALLRWLERVRINHLQLYTEHTFAYRAHELVWRNASPLTPDDVAWLEGECAARGIELVANQNCFGHFERWLQWAPYRHRAADPTAARPLSLAPTEDNARFALDLVAELGDAHTSRVVNIGCDEVFELHGRTEVFVTHLGRLLDGVRAQGRHPQFWADMVHGDPAAAAPVVGDATALLWHYEAPMDESVVDLLAGLELEGPMAAVLADWIASRAWAGFGPRAVRFAAADLDWWVCPGTSGWNSLVGRWPNARANGLDALEHGRTHGATGMLLTEWGDNGHLQPPSVMLPALTWTASLAWCLDANRDLDVAAALDHHVLGDRAGRAGAALLAAGEVVDRTGVLVPNGSALHPTAGGQLGGFGVPTGETLDGVRATLADVDQALAEAVLVDHDGAVTRRELRQAVALAAHGADRLARKHGLPAPPDADLDARRDDLADEQAACWGLRSRAGGRDDSLAVLWRS